MIRHRRIGLASDPPFPHPLLLPFVLLVYAIVVALWISAAHAG